MTRIIARSDPVEAVWTLMASVPDPEIPVLSVVDLGIVRTVAVAADGRVEVVMSPTYVGCPATDVIGRSIADALRAAGFSDATVRTSLDPPWTTDWITEAGREKLRRFGIAPPQPGAERLDADAPAWAQPAPRASCPRCGSRHTKRISEFGSTPCKAHYRCLDCLEPFDYFKCL